MVPSVGKPHNERQKDMYQQFRKLRERRAAGEIEGGFTLIELLIVIVVLGILAAIVVFALGSVTGKSASAACQSDARTVGTGVAALIAENSTLANTGLTTAQWQADMVAPSSTTITTPSVLGNPFIQTWPSSTSYVVWVGSGGSFATDYTSYTGMTPTPPTIPQGAFLPYSIAGTGNTASVSAVANGSLATDTYGDVYVTGLGKSGTDQGYTYDATTNPIEACNFAVEGHA